MKRRSLRIKCKVRLGCGHFVIEKLQLNMKGLKRYLYLRKRLCSDCWRGDQNRRKLWITEKLGLQKLRGNKPQFYSGMMLRGELALKLIEDGYSERCIITFLNSEQSAHWWVRNKGNLSSQFLQYMNQKESKAVSIARRTGVFLLLYCVLTEIQYQLFVMRQSISYD